MKNYIKVIYLISYFLFNGSFSYGQQVWKAQSCSTCCWAAATENVFNRMGLTTDECKLLQRTRRYAINCNNLTGLFGIDKVGYVGLTKQYVSFSYLESTQNTLSWNYIKNTIKPTNENPIIVSFDNGLSGNHFINILGTLEVANKQWLNVFDPYLTGKGLNYLKNYQTYQLPGINTGIQSTYWGFGQEKIRNTDTIFKALAVVGEPSIGAPIYTTMSKIKITINNLLIDSNRRKLSADVTGLKVGDNLKLDMSSMISLTKIDSLSQTQEIAGRFNQRSSVTKSRTNSYIIPIFKDNSNNLEFVSMMMLLKNRSESNYVIDRIQKLSIPILITEFTRNNSDGSIRINRNILNSFVLKDDGTILFNIKDLYYNISFNNISPINELQFYEEIFGVNPVESNKITKINPISLKYNLYNFRQLLINKGFSVQGNFVKINDENLKIFDFQSQLKKKRNVESIIILEKNKVAIEKSQI